MLVNMRQNMPFIHCSNQLIIVLTVEQKFISSPGLNRINKQKHILMKELETKLN